MTVNREIPPTSVPEEETTPMSTMRKIIARRMTENWNAVPRVTQFDEADITLDDDGLSRRRGGRDTQTRSVFAGRHRGVRRKVGVFGVPHHQRIEGGGIGKRPA